MTSYTKCKKILPSDETWRAEKKQNFAGPSSANATFLQVAGINSAMGICNSRASDLLKISTWGKISGDIGIISIVNDAIFSLISALTRE